ncbi:MAG: bifunctional phosphopantothenoylcysteine decarboxylase/phosphopantothenate--cysteine ligase CoaBC [Pseudobdellovibrio sp.]
MLKSNKNILVILTGSIACYKACSVISALSQKGFTVQVVLSPSSLQFIGAATIEGLTGLAPVTDMYASGSVMDHIHLARWADLILVAPATANYINKVAYGLGDDLLTTLFLAHDFKKPFLIAPAMNTMMYLHPTTQESINKLKSYGVEILETASGVLACGEVGYGRLLDPPLIVQEVENYLALTVPHTITSNKNDSSVNYISILITSGGTSEPIDDVRMITNKSSGKTAAFLVDQFIQSGIKVDYLHAKTAALPNADCEKIEFESFNDFQIKFKKQLQSKNYSWVIHAAALSDYSVDRAMGKISSDLNNLQINLKKNPKIINEIKILSPQSKLIGFKLTSGASAETINLKVSQQFINAHCDFVVQNDLQEIEKGNHFFNIFNSNLECKLAANKQELSYYLLTKILQERPL